MLLEPRLKLDEAELLLNPPLLLKALLLLELGERDTDLLLETRSALLGPVRVVDGRVVGLFAEERSLLGRLADERSAAERLLDERSALGRFADERSVPGRLLGCVDGLLRSPADRLLFGPRRSFPPNLSAVFRFEYGAAPR
jgi:hypothetical protein